MLDKKQTHIPELLDCLFIIPPYISGKASTFRAFEYTMPPLGVLYIAAYLRENKHTVDFLDFSKQKTCKDKEKHLQLLQNKYTQITYIGFSISTPAAYNAYKLINTFKLIFPNAKIIAGGPHVIGLKHTILNECADIDFAIDGEGEIPMGMLLDNKPLDEIPGLIYRKELNIISNPVNNKADLNKIPIPALDLIDFTGYGPQFSSVSNPYKMAGLFTSRGCPFKCIFCTRVTGSSLRFSPIGKIIAQILFFKNKWHITHFIFYDDTFTADKKFVNDVCEAILEKCYGITWICHGRVDTIDEPLLNIMKKAGCKSIYYGVESMDENVLKSIKKGTSTEQIKKAILLTKKVGIEVKISVLLGLPADTKESLLYTSNELVKLKADYIMLFVLTPFPGSEIYQTALAENRIKTHNWSDYNLSNYIYKHDTLTEKDIMYFQKLMYRKFYLRFAILIMFLKKLTSLKALKALLIGFWGLLKLLFIHKQITD